MKIRTFFLLFIFLWIGKFLPTNAQHFDSWFEDATLRLDYTLTGDFNQQNINFSEAITYPQWAGRRKHLDSLYLQGNGQIIVTDSATQRVLYKQSFSTLFQEWLHTAEAKHIKRSFEQTLLVPYPKQTIGIEITLYNNFQQPLTTIKHSLSPQNSLIRKVSTPKPTFYKYIHKGSAYNKAINVAIVAEGYTAKEKKKFYKDAQMVKKALFAHEPFKSYSDRFNLLAVALSSEDSGVSVPQNNSWKNTSLSSNFNTFYIPRYLTTLKTHNLHNQLAGLPYEHIIILVNSSTYGGGGILNQYTLATAHHEQSLPVIVHEFGHSFCGLADEYAYDSQEESMYPLTVEPWEKNITTLVNFKSKWADMVAPSTVIPTPLEEAKGNEENSKIGVYEGAGYQLKGVYRPTPSCRMKVNNIPDFCPVCQKALKELITYYTY